MIISKKYSDGELCHIEESKTGKVVKVTSGETVSGLIFQDRICLKIETEGEPWDKAFEASETKKLGIFSLKTEGNTLEAVLDTDDISYIPKEGDRVKVLRKITLKSEYLDIKPEE